MTSGRVWIRLLTACAALGAGAVAVVVAALLLRDALGTPATSSASTAAPAPAAAPAAPRTATAASAVPAGFPAPPPGAVVLAHEMGSNVLAVAAVDQPTGRLVQVSVLGPSGTGVRGLRVTVAAGGAARPEVACGAGCYRTTLHSTSDLVAVRVRGRAANADWHVALPRDAPSAAGFVRQATATWRALRSVSWHDVLGSSEHDVVTTEWQAAAPDRLAYRIRGGPSAVIIGDRRWDRQSRRTPWLVSQQLDPQHQPTPFWTRAVDAHVLGRATLGGRNLTRVSFFDPNIPAWFEILVDPSTMHTLRMGMYATAHFMHDTYRDFDAPTTIAPPVKPR